MAHRLFGTAFALLVVAACSNAPTTPGSSSTLLPQSSSFEGVWSVQFRIDGCTGYRHCINFKGKTETAYLRLARVGAAYEGVVDVGDHVSVTGVVAPDGTLTLTGKRDAAQADDYDIGIDPITLSSSATGGTVRYTTKGASNPYFYGNAMKEGPITAIERTGPLDSSASWVGTWTGRVPIRSCEMIGSTHCTPLWQDTTYPVVLTLAPGPSGVQGTLKLSGTTIPVAGTASGDTVRLAGTGLHPGSGGTMTYEVRAEALVSDRVGRLTGNLMLLSTLNLNDGRVQTVRYPPIPLYSAARSLR
jgi:hypothetical protein